MILWFCILQYFTGDGLDDAYRSLPTQTTPWFTISRVQPTTTSVKCQCSKPQQTRPYDAKLDMQKGITSEIAWVRWVNHPHMELLLRSLFTNIVPCLKQRGRDLTSSFCHRMCLIQPWKRSTPVHKRRQDLQKTACSCFKPRNTGKKCHLTSNLAFPGFWVFIFRLNTPLFRLLMTKSNILTQVLIFPLRMVKSN